MLKLLYCLYILIEVGVETLETGLGEINGNLSSFDFIL